MKTWIVLTSLLIFTHLAQAQISNESELGRYLISTQPDWAVKYPEGERELFRITDLMQDLSLTRLQAAELQNQYFDRLRAEPHVSPVTAFNSALENVRAARFESGLDSGGVAKAPFVVVFDLDNTLYDQRLTDAQASCASLSFRKSDGKMKHLLLAPRWETVFQGIIDLGGAIVLYSANDDQETYENLSHWLWKGIPLYSREGEKAKIHPQLSGIFTKNFLIRQAVTEVPGRQLRTNGTPVIEMSKDLRFIDESLTKVIIVDDNASRLFQLQNLRSVEKLTAADYCPSSTNAPSGDRTKFRAFQNSLLNVLGEIRESALYAKAHGTSFRDAFLPYTFFGEMTRVWLKKASGLTERETIEWMRRNPGQIRDKF
jgi:hypothetical protein